jgi:integrase
MQTRPLDFTEYKDIINLFISGFEYTDKDGKKRIFRPNRQISLALQMEASLGLRIGDVLDLKVSNFKNGKLEIREEKTNKLQYRDINPAVYNAIMDYAIENKLAMKDNIFNIGVRVVQKQLQIICNHLQLNNISTHSFRKMFATTAFEQNNHNLELVKEMLNHSTIAITDRYIRVSQKAINEASAAINFII